MIHDEVEQVGGRHLEQAVMKILFLERRARLGDGRLQEQRIPYPRHSTVTPYLVAVDFQDVFDAQKNGIHLFRQSFQGIAVMRIHPLQRFFHPLVSLAAAVWLDDENVAIGRDLQRRIGIHFEELKDRLLDYKRQAVSMFGKSLHDIHSVTTLYNLFATAVKHMNAVKGCPLRMCGENGWVGPECPVAVVAAFGVGDEGQDNRFAGPGG